MKLFSVITLSCLFLSGCNSPSATSKAHVIDESRSPPYLFVINAKNGSFQKNLLTLDPAPVVIYFTDRPVRKAGNITLRKFKEEWDSDADGSTAIATITWVTNNQMESTEIELSDMKIKRGKLTFMGKVSKTPPPKSFKASTIFVERVCSTLCP